MYKCRLFLIILLFPLILVSCGPDRKTNIDPADAWFDYMVWGDEESGTITVKLQYHANGPNGENLPLAEGGSVKFDGQPVKSDTAGFNGTYYEVIKPLAEFGGKHTIAVGSAEGTQYKMDFDFPIMTLKTELPKSIKRDSLVLELGGLQAQDTVRLLLTDTSLHGNGIEHLGTFNNGRLVIRQFRDLKNGPVYLEFIHEKQEPLRLTRPGGRFSLFYSLKRELMLEDSTQGPRD